MAVARTETVASPEFALESLEVEDEHVVVRGRWLGVTGRRFVRPALRLDDRRRVVASLEHKPWAAEEGAPWIAAFPHSGDDFASAALEVAPGVTVALKGEAPEERKAARAKPAKRRPKRQAEALRDARDEARRERDDLRSRLEHVTRARDEALEERDAALQEAEEAPKRAREQADAEIGRITAELESSGRAYDAAYQRATRAEAALEEAQQEAETLREQRSQHAEAVERVRRDLESERDAAGAEAARLRDELRAATASADEAARLRTELDRTRAERDQALAKAERPAPPAPRPAAPRPTTTKVARSRSRIELPPDPTRGHGARLAALDAHRPARARAPPRVARPVALVERVLGIGGYFFRAADPAALSAWYGDCLGVDPHEQAVWQQEAGPTVFAPFDAETDYFGSRAQQTMLNFRVRDLDAMLAQLRAKGADVAEETQDMDGVGRFGWVTDPEGNRIELWQPA